MYLLTLDLATHTGWTRGRPEDRHFEYGTHVLPKTGEDVGLFLAAYHEWLSSMLVSVNLCVFESPILPTKTSLATLRKLYSLAGHTEWLCSRYAVRCQEANLQSVKAFMGVTRMKGRDPKQAMIDAVRLFRYDPGDDNQADAIAVRLYTLHAVYPSLISCFRLELGALGAAAT